MGERTSYPHGTFSWLDNATTDQEGAKSFYSALFGWDWHDRPVDENYTYSMAQLGGHNVAAVSPQMNDERAMGVPPHWNNYVTVHDVDSVSGRVAALGGTVHAGPFDVMTAGRMSAVSDPAGAVFYLWQPNENPGAGLVNAPGALCWNELATREPEAAIAFYSELLGWSFDEIQGIPNMRYWAIMNAGRANGGMRLIGDETPADTPAHWLPYFAVESIDAAVETAKAAGGQVVVPKMAANAGNSFAALRDPAGAVFALFEGQLDD